MEAFFKDVVEEILKVKHGTIARFETVTSYWLGGEFVEKSNDWSWRVATTPFQGNFILNNANIYKKHHHALLAEYTNWKYSEANIGCELEGCTNDDLLFMNIEYSRTENSIVTDWETGVKKSSGLTKSYICMSECPRGYLWYACK